MLRPSVENVRTTPVFQEYFADPFVYVHEGVYYAVGTGPQEACGTGNEMLFPLLQSHDLKHWKRLGSALRRPDVPLGDTFWAPEVAYDSGTFYLYYSAGYADTRHQLRVAASESPAGPFIDCGVRLLGQPDCPFAIDPHPFRDQDGGWYLFYATDFLDERPPHRAGTGLKVARLASMTRLENPGVVVLRARSRWQLFQAARPIYGGVWDWHTLEGPAVRLKQGRYYCFYSGGRWENETYGVDYGVSDSVMGPFSDVGNENGPRLLRTLPGRLIGPGHNSIVESPEGEHVIFHAWDERMSARRMFVADLVWRE